MYLSPSSVVLLALVTISAAHAGPSQWHETARFRLGGSGGWDLMTVDADARRLYVTRGDRVMVVDIDRGTLVGDVPGLQKAHGVAIVPAHHRGYASSGGEDRVVVFDLDNLEILARIPVDHNPDAVVYDTSSDRVLAFNAGSNSVTIIDPVSDRRVATIPLPGKPELAVSNGKGGVFVNLEDVAKLARLDVRAAKVTSVWPLEGCEDPSGIALDRRHERLFSVCQNQLMVVTDARNGQHVASVPIGSGPDGAAFDPDSNEAFSSNSDGTLTIVHEKDPNHFMVAQSLPTPVRSRCIAFDVKTHHAILATAEFGSTPPKSTSNPRPRPPMVPGSFGLISIGRQ